jgi:hypothetical protein
MRRTRRLDEWRLERETEKADPASFSPLPPRLRMSPAALSLREQEVRRPVCCVWILEEVKICQRPRQVAEQKLLLHLSLARASAQSSLSLSDSAFHQR